MELTLNESQAKALIKEVLVELLEEREEWFSELLIEALEEIGLAKAIQEGRQDDFVAETEIMALLEGHE